MIYKATIKDIDAIVDMAIILYKHNERGYLRQKFYDLIVDSNCAIYIISEADTKIGFAQVQLRYDYVEGTNSSPVGYLEGIFVRKEYRKQGYAHILLKKCEEWARENGCTEFASDCELLNDKSLAFHLAVGFLETNRIICFKKSL